MVSSACLSGWYVVNFTICGQSSCAGTGTGVWSYLGKGSLFGLRVTWIILLSPYKLGAGYTGSVSKCYFLAKGSDTSILLRPLFLAVNCTNDDWISLLVVVISW